MSATEIINELPNLTDAERRAVLEKLRELAHQNQNQAASHDRMEEEPVPYQTIDLRARGISEVQAADLRSRLNAFAEDWDRPEASIYDEDSRDDVISAVQITR
jgi:hypothetical protein